MERWLVIVIHIFGQAPATVVDEKVASRQVCIEVSDRALDTAEKARADGGFEFQVTCAIIKFPETPASIEE